MTKFMIYKTKTQPITSDFDKQLYSLKQLLDDGIITQQEFDDKKKKILGL